MKSNYDMAWYFEKGLEKSAELLDDSNFCRDTFPIINSLEKELPNSIFKEAELGYSYPGGKKSLRSLIAEHESYLEETPIHTENIIVHGGGCTGAIDNIFRTISKKCSKKRKLNVIIPVPVYPEIIKSVRYNGFNPIYLKTKRENGFQPTINEVNEVRDKDTNAIFITTPGNPAGVYINQQELIKIINLAIKEDYYFIIDSIFEETTLNFINQNIFQGLTNKSKIIKIKGWSKDRPQLNDLRLSWTVSKNQEINDDLIEVETISKYSASKLSQLIAMIDIKYRLLQDKIKSNEKVCSEKEKLIKSYIANLHDIYSKINSGMKKAIKLMLENDCIVDVVTPDVGNLIFVRARDNPKIKNSHELFLYLLDNANIAVTPGSLFFAPEKELWFRLSMTKKPDIFVDNVRKILYTLSTSREEIK